MTGNDDEFDDFLRRRRPVFGRPSDDLEPPAELDRIVLRQAREAIEADKPQRVFRAPYWSMPVALAATLVLAFTIILNVGMPTRQKKPEVTVQNVSRQLDMPAAEAPPPPVAAAAMEARAAAPTQAESVREDVADNGAVVVDLAASAAETQPPEPAESNTRSRRLEKLADNVRRPAAPPFVSEEEASRYSQPAGASSGRTTADDQHTGVIINGERAEVSRTGELRTEPAAAGKAAAPAPAWRRDSKTWLAEIERLRAAGDVARADAELAEYKRQHRAYAGAPDR
jgi:hypothetical protein